MLAPASLDATRLDRALNTAEARLPLDADPRAVADTDAETVARLFGVPDPLG